MLDRRVLYIDGRDNLRVFQDGPSLVMRPAAGAARRFPFRRLSRIVVTGSVNWPTQALLACADAAIPVCFLDRRGNVRASFKPPAPRIRLSKLRLLIERYFRQASGADAGYQSWFSCEHDNARAAFTEAAGLAGDQHGRRCPHAASLHLLARYVPAAQARAFDARLAGQLRAHVEYLLETDGITTDLPVLRQRFINLAHDYTQILAWRLRLNALRHVKAEYVRAQRRGAQWADVRGKLAVEVYESASREIERRFASLVRRHRNQIKHVLEANPTHVK